MRMFREVLQVYVTDGNRSKMLETCVELGDPARGGDPQLWMQLLEHMGTADDITAAEVEQVLQHIEAGNLLPPLLVLKALARNPRLQLGTVRGYLERTLAADTAAIQEDRAQVTRYRDETAAMRAELEELSTTPRVFQNSKCALSGAALELPAVHFLCGHSFNLRAMPDTEGRECPLCAPGCVLLNEELILVVMKTRESRIILCLNQELFCVGQCAVLAVSHNTTQVQDPVGHSQVVGSWCHTARPIFHAAAQQRRWVFGGG